jgi:two-component system nitrogen regulation response regulator NtrX
MAKILIIDDEERIRQSLKSALERREHEVVTAATLAEGRRFVTVGFDVVLLDVLLPDGNGVDLLKELAQEVPGQPVVMISGHADVEMAVQAVRHGAVDFLEKPLSLDKLLVLIDNVCRTSRIISEKDRLSSRLYGELVGESEVMKEIRRNIARVADRTSRFLVTGESGTGKELVALLIHRMSAFAKGPFVAVNCAALPADLVESELFGHVPGAFTGAKTRRAGRFSEGNHGTVFLDEISEMSLEAQAKLLRVLENRTYTPVGSDKPQSFEGNVVAASNRDVEEQVKAGRFREDLLYRLNVVELRVPPLRERRDDIPLLAQYFLSRFSEDTGAPAKKLDDTARATLMSCDFPGNVRELRNLMERVSIYSNSETVTAGALGPLLTKPAGESPRHLKDAVREFEKSFIKAELARTGGNVTRAAQNLGLERSHLYKKLKQFESADD